MSDYKKKTVIIDGKKVQVIEYPPPKCTICKKPIKTPLEAVAYTDWDVRHIKCDAENQKKKRGYKGIRFDRK